MTWTRFMDMHSGGGTKEEPYEYIYIEASEDEARVIFYNRFGHSSERVTCTCCGEDYSVAEDESLAVATAYDRNCKWVESGRGADGKWLEEGGGHYEERPKDPGDRLNFGGAYLTLDEYEAKPDVLVIRADEIKDSERKGSVPEQGYVWQD